MTCKKKHEGESRILPIFAGSTRLTSRGWWYKQYYRISSSFINRYSQGQRSLKLYKSPSHTFFCRSISLPIQSIALKCFFIYKIFFYILFFQERPFRMEFVSQQPFTDSEFTKWREDTMMAGINIPSVQVFSYSPF